MEAHRQAQPPVSRVAFCRTIPWWEIMRIAITILAALTAAVTAMGTASAATQSKAQSPTVPQVLMLNQLNGTVHAYQQPVTLNVQLDVPPYPPSRVLRNLHWARWDAVSAAGTGLLWVEGNSGPGPPPPATRHCSAVIDLRMAVLLRDRYIARSRIRQPSAPQVLLAAADLRPGLSEGVAGGGQYDWEWQPYGWVQVQGA